MTVDRRKRSHDSPQPFNGECGYADVQAKGDGVYVCVKCLTTMSPHWPALVLAAGLKLPKWPKKALE